MTRTRRTPGTGTPRAFKLGMEQLEDRAVPSTVDLVVDKTTPSADGSGNVTRGDLVTYQVVVSNNGPGTATGATFTDDLPASLTNVTWTSSTSTGVTGSAATGSGDITETLTLPSGASITYTITGTLGSTATGTLQNTATATVNSSVDTDTNAANNSDTVTNTILIPTVDVGVTKTDTIDTVAEGQTITYTIVVSNNGSTAVANATLTDNFPTSLTNVNWTSAVTGTASGNQASGTGNINDTGLNLDPGATITYTITAVVDPNAVAPGNTIQNVATVSGVAGDVNVTNDTATDIDTVATANLSVTKTDNVTNVAAGQAVTYTIVVSNTGGADLTGVSFTDDLPATLTGVTWTSTPTGGATGNSSTGSGDITQTLNLPSGSSVTYTVTAVVANGTAVGTTISNTAVVTTPSGVTETNAADNSATDVDTVQALDLSVVKTNNVTTVAPGQSVTYTITVSNAAGNADVTGATLTDTFPAGLDLTSVSWTSTATGGASGNQASGTGNINATGLNLPAGSSITYTVTALVSDTATGTVQNTATVTASGDTNTANNTSTDTDTVSIPTGPVNLAITKTDNSKFAVRGATTTYTIVVTNLGSNTAAGVQVQDILPSGIVSGSTTWTSQYSNGTTGASGTGNIIDTVTLAAGQSITYTLTAAVSASATGGLTNTATVTPASGITDTDPSNNTASDRDTVLPKFVPAYFNQYAVGADAGVQGHVKVFAPDGTLRFSFFAFAGFNGGVHVATGDVNGDGVNDIVVSAGSGAPGGHVKVFDGETGALIASFFTFANFFGGTDVAVGDVNNDGFGDLIVGSGNGAGHVKVFSFATGVPVEIASFYAYTGFTSGINVAAGDVNGDGFDDIITGTVFGPAHVKVISLATGAPVELFSQITLPGYFGGIDVAAGNLRGDARDEFVIAPISSGANGVVQVFSIDSTSPIAAFVPNFTGRDRGLRVAVADADNDGDDDIIVAGGPGRGSKVKAFAGDTLVQIKDFDAFPGFQGGVFVG